MLDGSLELDKRMSVVMAVGWQSFTIGTEIGVMADSTLVADAPNVRPTARFVLTKRAVTVDAVVDLVAGVRVGNRLVQGCKAMSWMVAVSCNEAVRAIIPIRAAQALVSDAYDVLKETVS